MARAGPVRFNVRSAFARRRARELAEQTGMTVTEVVEDALRGYAPTGQPAAVAGLVRRGNFLVAPARDRRVSLEEENAAFREEWSRALLDSAVLVAAAARRLRRLCGWADQTLRRKTNTYAPPPCSGEPKAAYPIGGSRRFRRADQSG